MLQKKFQKYNMIIKGKFAMNYLNNRILFSIKELNVENKLLM